MSKISVVFLAVLVGVLSGVASVALAATSSGPSWRTVASQRAPH